MKDTKIFLIIIFLLPFTASAQSGLDTLALEDIFYEPLLAGNRADFVRFSADGSAIFYMANDSAMTEEELFRVSLSGENRQRVDEDSFIRRYEVSFNRSKVAYSDEGNIWMSDMEFTNPKKIIATSEWEADVTWGPDSLRFAFVQGGEVMIMDVKDIQITQVTEKEEDDPNYSIIGWAGNHRLILRQYDNSEVKTVYFPEYIGEWVQPGGDKRGFGVNIISVAFLKSGEMKQLHHSKKFAEVEISPNGRYLAMDILNTARKKRKIKVIDFKKDTSHIVFRDSTGGWFYYTNMKWDPESERLMFHSEMDGWNHLYTISPDGSNLRQLTEGKFEVPWMAWLNEDKIIFASTKVSPGERHLYALNLETGAVKRLTQKPGFRQNFHLSRDKQYVVYEYTYFNQPFELFALNVENPDEEIRLTYTIPERFQNLDWQKPDYFHFTARDGREVYMRVLKPRDMKEGKQYPVVVFVHGAGSLQNVYKGWSNHYWREYMFNQFLTEHGYFVFQVDYRHSTGYGRDFRDKVTGWMGKYETHDIVDGLKYLAEHYPQADTSRVGIYGGSYGGFMALYATSVAPEHFDAAAALREVTNWVNYYRVNPWYTKPRLGTPEDDSLNYARSSPLTYVDQLRQPVLILHGLMDNNVPFRDAAQYIHKLIQTGDKEFYFMMYPAERHSFQDPDAWYDEYSRIYRFFNRELKEELE